MSLSTLPADTAAPHAPTKHDAIEDFAGRTLMLLWWFWSLTLQINSMIGLLGRITFDLQGALSFSHSLLLIIFTGLAAWLTIARKPVKAVAGGVEARVVALLGSFLLFGLPFLPTATTPINLQVIALPITVIGLVGSVYCLAWLGRSFSIMATARSLVTGGPYGVVRHPLYATEMIMVLGLCIWNLSVMSMVLFIAILLCQVRRIHHEEKVLRAAFPEYQEYASRVPQLFPFPASR